MDEITVIIPVFNAEATLKKCIESVLNQTYNAWRLILIDDGSKDKSSEICDFYASEYENIMTIHIENQGVSNARNLGMENTETEYFVFIDSDDYVEPDYLECLMTAKEKFPDAGHYWCCMRFVNSNGDIMREYTAGKDEYSVFDKTQIMTLNEKIIAPGPVCKLNRMSVIRNNMLKMNTDYDMGEDFMFNLDYIDASQNGKIIVINKAAYNCNRSNGESLDHKYRDDMLDIAIYLREYIKAYLDKWNVPEKEYSSFWNSYFYSLIKVLDNTMSDKNKKSLKEKTEYNSAILKSDIFRQVLANRNCSVNSLLLKALKSGNYNNVIRFNRLVKIKQKFFH